MDDFAFQMESGPVPVVGSRLEDLAFQTHSVPASDIACVWIVRVPDAVDQWPEKWQDLAKWEKQSIDNPRTISELLALLSRSPDQDVARSSAPAWLLICARDKKGEWFFTRCLVYDKHAYNMPPSHPDEAGSHGGDICPEFVHFLKRMFPHLVRETKGHALAKKSSTQTRRRSYYRSGALRTDIPLRNGKPHGEAVTYFSSGAVSMRIPYVEGVVHGRTRSYLENGKLVDAMRVGDGDDE